jgi:hypothetical protein
VGQAEGAVEAALGVCGGQAGWRDEFEAGLVGSLALRAEASLAAVAAADRGSAETGCAGSGAN